jgi:hypothetical protein
MIEEARRLLTAMYENCGGWLDLRAFQGGTVTGREFAGVSDFATIERFALEHRLDNVFFGVGTRDRSGGGCKSNVVDIPALWADVDFKDTPPSATAEALSSFPYRPSTAVLSGHGVHFYWILREPATIKDAITVEDRLRRVCQHFKADPSTCEIARVLRLPGTMNCKRTPHKPVKLHSLDDYRYNLEDFNIIPEVNFMASRTGSGCSMNPPGWMVEAFKGVPEGGNVHFAGRDAAGVKIAGYFVKQLPEHDLLNLLRCWNIRNSPPLGDDDLQRIIKSVGRYREPQRHEQARVKISVVRV